MLHEDAAHQLGFAGGPEAVPALVGVTRSHPAYLEHDRGAALARKAVHSLDRILGADATRALVELTGAQDATLREIARRVLDRHGP